MALLIGFFLIAKSSGGGTNAQLIQRTSLRLSALESFLSDDKTTRNLKNQQLAQLVLNSSITLTSDVSALSTVIGVVKYDTALTASESDTTSADALEQAALDGKLDGTYARIYSEKLTSLRALLAETIPSSKSDVRAELKKIDRHLSDQQSQLSKISL